MIKNRDFREFKETYLEVVREFNIDTRKSYKRQVQQLVILADDIQSQICNSADTIKISDYEDIVNNVDSDMSKDAWKEIVSLNSRSASIKQSTREKYIKKTRQQIKSEMYKTMQLNNDYKAESDIPIPAGNVNCKVNEEVNNTYSDILRRSTSTRNYINNVLYKKYKKLAEAAEYISEGDVTYDRFKSMVDYEHYLGGYPSDNSPAKIDATICKFLECYYLLKKYHPEFFDEHFNPMLEQYNNMFEIVEKRIKPTAKFNP